MQDHAHDIRQRLIAETPAETPLDIKRRAALAYLGERHILHTNYQFTPRHSLTRWQPHSILRPVQLAAQQACRI